MAHIQISKPLKTKGQIQLVRSAFKHTKYPLRNRLIFDIGINNGVRTGDLVTLKVKDVLNDDNSVHHKTVIEESKTGKTRTLRFNSDIRKEIRNYLNKRGLQSEWLFPNYKDHRKHINTNGVYTIFRRISNSPQCKDKIIGLTAHSLRRTFGYWYYKRTHDIATLMRIFNHSSEAITLRYIDESEDELDQKLSHFKL